MLLLSRLRELKGFSHLSENTYCDPVEKSNGQHERFVKQGCFKKRKGRKKARWKEFFEEQYLFRSSQVTNCCSNRKGLHELDALHVPVLYFGGVLRSFNLPFCTT
jgi:hypothetical protein